jgi:DNA-binding LytR/AlgR family response regulator
LVEEGVPAKELHTLLEIAKANIAFVFFVGGRPVIAETAEASGLPLQLKDFREDHLMPLLEKTDLGGSGAGMAPLEGAFFAKSESVIQRIVLKDLICVEAMKDYVLVHQTRSSHKVLSSMKHFEARLPKQDFVRIHRSFIVRISSIISIDGDTVNCESGFKLPIGPSFRQSLLARLNFI